MSKTKQSSDSRELLRRLWKRDQAADLVEYVVLAALFALVLGIAMSGLDETVSNNFTATTTDLTVPVSPTN